MNKKLIVIIATLTVIAAYLGIRILGSAAKEETEPVLSSSESSNAQNFINNNSSAKNTPVPEEKIPADKIEVVHFHGTYQCWSCITVGEYALKTIKEKFPEEYASGKIIFKEINGELPENKDIVMKYQARGSSIFVNAIRGEKDNISEDVTVWRLVGNEQQFTDYFEKKLKTFLNK